jgi:hypothetical protein
VRAAYAKAGEFGPTLLEPTQQQSGQQVTRDFPCHHSHGWRGIAVWQIPGHQNA